MIIFNIFFLYCEMTDSQVKITTKKLRSFIDQYYEILLYIMKYITIINKHFYIFINEEQ
jgi:hypothetical protein